MAPSIFDYNPVRYQPTKRPVLAATLVQLLTVLPTFVEVSFVLTRDRMYFEHEATRATVTVCWWVLLLWLSTISVNVYAIVTNSYIMLIPNIIFCVLMVLPSFATFITIVTNGASSNWGLLASIGEMVMVIGCIYFEGVAFTEMREILG